jgi:ring-1,2-phenylacetyl-CoA epoxidase subunit PaaE
MGAAADAGVAAPSRGAFHPLTIAHIDRLCEDAVAVTFDVPAHLTEVMRFRPGEHVNVRRVVDGVEHRRSYSICAPAGGPLRVGVRRVPGGVFSEWALDAAAVGDQVDVQPPTGRFVVDPGAGGSHVLVAAGSGITPVLSIAASLLECSDAEVTLVYGNRRAATTMFLEELADLKNRFPARFDLVHVLSREPRDVELFSGRLDGARLHAILEALVPWRSADGFWLCGPMGMLEQHRSVLRDLGVPPAKVHSELFYADDPPPPVVHEDEVVAGPSYDLTFTLDGRTTSVTGPRSRTVLENATAARTDVPFACRGGVCGTCRARVVDGAVEMRRNYALEDNELTEGFVLTCQSIPTTESVVVDYDS